MFTFTATRSRRLVALATVAAAVAVPPTAFAECCPVDGGTPSVIPAGQPGGPESAPPVPTSLPPGGDQSVIPPGQPGGGTVTQPPLPPGVSGGDGGSVMPAGQPGSPDQHPASSILVIGAGQPQAETSVRATGMKFPERLSGKNLPRSKHTHAKKRKTQRRSPRLRRPGGR